MNIIFSILISITVLLTLTNACAATLRLNTEQKDSDQSQGVAIIIDEYLDTASTQLALGISINNIKSDQALEYSSRKEIYPVYGFVSISLQQAVSPYFEFGMDIGDAMIDDALNGDGQEIDIYYSVGVRLKLQKTVDIAIYHKLYDLRYTDIADPVLQNVILDMTGVSVSFYFN